MPSRLFVIAILVFWGVTTVWFYNRDLRLLVLRGEAPQFTIDLEDEATAQAESDEGGINWKVFQNGQEKGYALTFVRYRDQDDTFEVGGQYKFWLQGRSGGGEPQLVIASSYRVTREGDLRGIEAHGTMLVPLGPQFLEISGDVRGKVFGGRFTSHAWIRTPWGKFDQELEPVDITTRGSVLNPMQPLNRLTGLRKKQRWHQPLIDPLADALRGSAARLNLPGSNVVGPTPVRFVEARVLPRTEFLEWGAGPESIPCLVIEYNGEDIEGQTWVRESDGMVYQQEITQRGEHLKLVRMDPREGVPR